MTYFIQDLKNYIVSNGLVPSGKQFDVEFYEEGTTGELFCISCYDTDAEQGQYSIQILKRAKFPKDCLDGLYTIFNHFFSTQNLIPVYKVVNNTKCLFRPLSKPMFLKKDNGLMYYVFNMEVLCQK